MEGSLIARNILLEQNVPCSVYISVVYTSTRRARQTAFGYQAFGYLDKNTKPLYVCYRPTIPHKLLRQEALELNNKPTKTRYGMVVILPTKFSVLLEVKHMPFLVILHTANQSVEFLWTAIRPQPLYTITLDIPHHGTTKGIRESIVDFKAHTHSNEALHSR